MSGEDIARQIEEYTHLNTPEWSAAVVLTIILIVSVIVGVQVVNTKVELRRDAAPDFISFELSNVRDAVITIDFIDDPTLIFRYTYELYPGSNDLRYYSFDSAYFWELWGTEVNSVDPIARVKTFNLTLGNYPPSYLSFEGIKNSTVIILCRNNATLSGLELYIFCDSESVVFFALDDDVNFDQEGMTGVIDAHTIYLSATLPDSVNGEVEMWSGEINAWEHEGWHRENRFYRTEEDSEPLVQLKLYANILHLWLYT